MQLPSSTYLRAGSYVKISGGVYEILHTRGGQSIIQSETTKTMYLVRESEYGHQYMQLHTNGRALLIGEIKESVLS